MQSPLSNTTRLFWPSLLPALLFAVFCASARAGLNVVVTLPDLAAVAREIAGDLAQITILAQPAEDPHFVDARPSFIRILNKADILVEGGAELEVGWLAPLVQNARNAKILPGGAGVVDASLGLELLDKPDGKVDRSAGDVHLAGNPHYMLSPVFAARAATNLARAFATADAAHAGAYLQNLARFSSNLAAKSKSWQAALEPNRHAKVITYHRSFDYLLNYFGLELVDTIEPKPGIEPSPTHITNLIRKNKGAAIRFILIEPNRARKTPERLGQEINAPVVVLPLMPGALPKTEDYFSWMDYLAARLAGAPAP